MISAASKDRATPGAVRPADRTVLSRPAHPPRPADRLGRVSGTGRSQLRPGPGGRATCRSPSSAAAATSGHPSCSPTCWAPRRCRAPTTSSRTSTRPRWTRWRPWPRCSTSRWGPRPPCRPPPTNARPSTARTSWSSPSPPAGSTPWRVDLDVPARHGIRQSVGDTVGPGGHQPLPAQHPGPGRDGRGHGGGLPRRLAAQHHQPDDLPDPRRLPGDLGQDRRPVPRGRELVHGPGHRARSSRPRRSGPPWPGSTTSRWSPPWTSTGGTDSTILAEMVDEAGGLGRPGARRRAAPRPRPSRRLDFVQRHAAQAHAAGQVGCPPRRRRPPHRRVPAVGPHRGVGLGRRLQPRADPHRHAARSTRPSYIADVDAWLAGTKELADLVLGRAPGPGHRLAGDR